MPDASSNASCPRCGYDQRGVMDGWHETCPMHGRCAECGLEFLWGELLGWKLEYPHWCVERHDSRFIRPRQIAGTFTRTYVPWTFWRQIRMTHPSRWGRLTAYCTVLLVALYLIFAVSHASLVWGEWQADVSQGHRPSTSGALVFFQAAGFPFSNESVGTFTITRFGRTGAVAYGPPRTFLPFWERLAMPIFLVVAGHFACGLAFVVLPHSRKMAKVRRGHIARVTLYGCGLIVPALLLMMLVAPFAMHQWPGAGFVVLLAIVAGLAIVPLELMWWTMAAWRYLRMSLPLAIGLSVVVLGFFTPFAVAGFVWSMK